MTFKKGESGNKAGRPRGIIDRRLAYNELFQSHAPKIIAKAIEMAKNGNEAAIKLCMERISPRATELPLRFKELGNTTDLKKLAEYNTEIINATARGEILLGDALKLSTLLDDHRKAIVTGNLSNKISEIEEWLEDIRKPTNS